MIAPLCFFLTLLVTPFKTKSRPEAENAALRHQVIVAAGKGARSRPTHKWGSPVLSPAVSMVPIGPECHHDHPTGDPHPLASRRLASVLALEIPPPWRLTANRCGPPSQDWCTFLRNHAPDIAAMVAEARRLDGVTDAL